NLCTSVPHLWQRTSARQPHGESDLFAIDSLRYGKGERMNAIEMFSLKGKTALVTGCRRGIGLAMAVGLAEAGADIVGVSATLAADGEDVGRQVRAAGRKFSAYSCDFSD